MTLHLNKSTKKAIWRVLLSLYRCLRLFMLIGISYVVLYPILSMVLQSITMPDDALSGTHVWMPDNPTFRNYRVVMSYFKYSEHLTITLEIVLVCTFFQLLICSLVGYGLARFKFKGNGIVFALVLATIILPIQTAQIPMYLDFLKFDFFGIGSLVGLVSGKPITVNLLNTKWVYFLPSMFGVGLNSGLYIFLFRQFFKGIPKDLEDAGRVDGCNPLQTFLRVVAPNTLPVFVTVALLSTIFYWNDTLIGRMFLNSAENRTLMLYVETSRDANDAWMIRNASRAEYAAEGYVIMLITVVPLVLVYIGCQKFFTECMDRSGIKG